ncbi:MAG: hypothetical protein VB106_01815 [Clostridiaceae bacterium]|nr:hypothetical protein [Clostridiaceae bacterium]
MRRRVPVVVLAGILLWGVVIVVCRHKGGARSYMGCGCALYGKRARPNGYIAIKWIVLILIPIFPVATYEVFEEGSMEGLS